MNAILNYAYGAHLVDWICLLAIVAFCALALEVERVDRKYKKLLKDRDRYDFLRRYGK